MEVTYIDHMGSDLRVVNAARVSFAKESQWETKDIWSDMWQEMDEQEVLSLPDQKLIKYLATHNHWTPFSHVQITLREKVPIFVARQRFKHMVGFTYNEVSRRYVDDTPEFYVPDAWRKRAENKKQGSSDEVVAIDPLWNVDLTHETYHPGVKPRFQIDWLSYQDLMGICEKFYQTLLENEVAPEQARMVLPQSMYTEFYSTGSLSAWSRMINLRKDSHAQKEIQDLARMCDEIIREINELKYSWDALVGPKWY